MTAEKREAIKETLAQRYLDCMDLKALETFFIETQLEYLESYTDDELLGDLEDYMEEEEFQEVFGEAG